MCAAEAVNERMLKSPRAERRGVIEPMQCLAVGELPSTSEWTFELKFDGFRGLAVKHGSGVKLYSRNANVLNARFPEVVDAVGQLLGDFVLDGEIVALTAEGKPSFSLLQNSGRYRPPIYFYAFDHLGSGGRSFIDAPIEERRERLQTLLSGLPSAGIVRQSPILKGEPAALVNAVKQLGLEGVVGKRLGSRYEPGKRSGAWIKHRTNRGQEFVIGGFTPGTRGFDALLVGFYNGKQLRYAGKVRNGFTPYVRDAIFPKIKAAAGTKCPFANLPEVGRTRWGEALTAEKMKECRWLRPKLVCQVDFVEWTQGDRLRHPVFIGLRDDKPASQVVREG